VRVPTTESAAVGPGEKVDTPCTRGEPSDRTDKHFSGACGAERFRADRPRFCAAEGHLKYRAKSEPSEQPPGCSVPILDHSSKLGESDGASVGQEAGQELAPKTLPPPRELDTKTAHPTFAVTKVVQAAKGDPTSSFYPRPESSFPNPLVDVLDEIVVRIGF